MKAVDFYGLTRASQDKLLGSLGGQYEPKPILWRRGIRLTLAAWVGLSVVSALLLIAVCIVGFGELESSFASHPLAFIAAYMVLAGLAAYGVIRAAAYRFALKQLPFVTGIYVFPANVIDARDARLGVVGLNDLSDVSPRGGGEVQLRFGTRRFSFPMDARSVERAVELVKEARNRLTGPLKENERRMLDPLEPPVFVSPLAPTDPLKREKPRWASLAAAIAAGFGVVFGAVLFFARDELSDTRMFAAARARDEVGAYHSYLERGSDHRDVVAKELLPRAELRAAISSGTVEAIDKVMSAYPDTAISAELQAARRAALIASFTQARKARTLAALLAFEERHKNHGLDRELKAARHAIYNRALARYQQLMPEGGGADEFVQRMLGTAEKMGARKTPKGVRGPTVEVRFRRVPSRDMDRADDLVRQNPMYRGETSVPTQYLDDKHLEPHQTRTAKAIAAGLSKAFPAEVISFEAAAPLDGSKDLPPVKVPTLVISYRMEPSGAAYASKTPRGIYVGLAFFNKLELILPGDDQPHRAEHNISTSIPVDELRKKDSSAKPGELETLVYEAMLRDGFKELEERYLAQWFRK